MNYVLIAILLVPIIGAVAASLALAHRKRQTVTGPICGNCAYNLTGAPENRCPECGRLFALMGFGSALTMAFVAQARRAQAQAVMARTAAAQAQQQAAKAQAVRDQAASSTSTSRPAP
jgi:hypothetical protein